MALHRAGARQVAACRPTPIHIKPLSGRQGRPGPRKLLPADFVLLWCLPTCPHLEATSEASGALGGHCGIGPYALQSQVLLHTE